ASSMPDMSPRSFVLNVSPWLTPGISVPSCRKLRPLSGSSRTCSPVTRPAFSADGLNGHRRALNSDGLRKCAGLELHVLGADVGNVEDDAGANHRLESGERGFDGV